MKIGSQIRLALASTCLLIFHVSSLETDILELKDQIHQQSVEMKFLQNAVEELRTKGEENVRMLSSLLETNFDLQRKCKKSVQELYKKYKYVKTANQNCACPERKGKHSSECSRDSDKLELSEKGRQKEIYSYRKDIGLPGTSVQLASNNSFLAHLSEMVSIETPTVLVFDTVITNLGNHYNHTSGIFTVPVNGTYVFLWKILVLSGGLRTELCVNEIAQSAIYNDPSDKNMASATGFAVIQVVVGDSVFIRAGQFDRHDTVSLSSTGYDYSSFAGYILP